MEIIQFESEDVITASGGGSSSNGLGGGTGFVGGTDGENFLS